MRTHVARALVNCRQGRQALSLVLVEIDHFASLARTLGPVAAEQTGGRTRADLQWLRSAGASLLQARQACFALVLPDCDRGEAVAVADDILHHVRQESDQSVGDRWARRLGERRSGDRATSAQEFSGRRPDRQCEPVFVDRPALRRQHAQEYRRLLIGRFHQPCRRSQHSLDACADAIAPTNPAGQGSCRDRSRQDVARTLEFEGVLAHGRCVENVRHRVPGIAWSDDADMEIGR